MNSLDVCISVESHIKSLINTSFPSYGILVGARGERSATVEAAISFKEKRVTNISQSILSVKELFLCGSGLIGLFVVSNDDPKDVPRMIMGSISNNLLPRPIVIAHFHAKSSKFTCRNVIFDGEDKFIPVDWRTTKEDNLPLTLLSSQITYRNLVEIPDKYRFLSDSNIGELIPKPTSILFRNMVFSEKLSTVPLGTICCQSIENDDEITEIIDVESEGLTESGGGGNSSSQSENNHSNIAIVEVGLGFPLTSSPSLRVSNGHAGRRTVLIEGTIPIITACHASDTTAALIQAVQSALNNTIGSLLKTVPISLTKTSLPSEIGLLYLEPRGGSIQIPLLVPSPAHPSHQAILSTVKGIFDLSTDPLYRPIKSKKLVEEIKLSVVTLATAAAKAVVEGSTNGTNAGEANTAISTASNPGSTLASAAKAVGEGEAVEDDVRDDSGNEEEEGTDDDDEEEEELEATDSPRTPDRAATRSSSEIGVEEEVIGGKGTAKKKIVMAMLIGLGVLLVFVAVGVKLLTTA